MTTNPYLPDVPGLSGCLIAVLTHTPGGMPQTLKKSAGRKDYFSRLLAQANKQQQFAALNRLAWIKTPEIYEAAMQDDECYFTMEFIHAQHFHEFLSAASNEEIDKLGSRLISLIEQSMGFSAERDVSYSVILNKVAEIRRILAHNPLLRLDRSNVIPRALKRIESLKIDTIRIPIGFCHGDLTFSNMLFRPEDDTLFVIDFLDSFIESPLIDIVKLRQDTYLHWTTRLIGLDAGSELAKISMAFARLDNMITKHFSIYPFFQKWYPLMQLLNLARIVPYIQEVDRMKIILSIMHRVEKEGIE